MSTVNAQRAYRSDEWLAHNRAAFLDGYADAYGADPRDDPALLIAYELTKAIYEVDYELGHRPGWVRIPLDAVRSLTSP
jgi:maltokinase